MSTVNEVRLIGNLGQNPEIFTSEKGNKILKVSLATNETFKNDKGEKVTKTEWHNLAIFGKRAEIVAKFCHKGSKLLIVGKLTSRSFVDKNDVTRYVTEVIVDDALFLDTKPA